MKYTVSPVTKPAFVLLGRCFFSFFFLFFFFSLFPFCPRLRSSFGICHCFPHPNPFSRDEPSLEVRAARHIAHPRKAAACPRNEAFFLFDFSRARTAFSLLACSHSLSILSPVFPVESQHQGHASCCRAPFQRPETDQYALRGQGSSSSSRRARPWKAMA